MQTLRGTVEYLAPEMLEGRPYTHLVDSYSLGLVIYNLYMLLFLHFHWL